MSTAALARAVVDSLLTRAHMGAPVGHTGAMVALIPTVADAKRLAVDGGELAAELHVTLYHLGEGDDFSPDSREHLAELVRGYVAQLAPVEADGFAVAVFNPPGLERADGKARETCIVLGLSGEGLAKAKSAVDTAVEDYGADLPEQHKPWAPHATLIYTDDTAMVGELLDRTGPVTFDRVRLAFGGEHIDIPLTDTAEGASETQRAWLAASERLDAGAFTINELRARKGRPAVAWGGRLWAPLTRAGFDENQLRDPAGRWVDMPFSLAALVERFGELLDEHEVGDYHIHAHEGGRVALTYDADKPGERYLWADFDPDDARTVADDVESLVGEIGDHDLESIEHSSALVVENPLSIGGGGSVGFDHAGDVRITMPGRDPHDLDQDEATDLVDALREAADEADLAVERRDDQEEDDRQRLERKREAAERAAEREEDERLRLEEERKDAEEAAQLRAEEEREAAESWWEDVSIRVGDNRLDMESPTVVEVQDHAGGWAATTVPVEDLPALTAAIRDLRRQGDGLPEFVGEDEDGEEIEPESVAEVKVSDRLTLSLFEDGELRLTTREDNLVWDVNLWRDNAAELADQLDRLREQILAAPKPARSARSKYARAGFDSGQYRLPAGVPDGGQWAKFYTLGRLFDSLGALVGEEHAAGSYRVGRYESGEVVVTYRVYPPNRPEGVELRAIAVATDADEAPRLADLIDEMRHDAENFDDEGDEDLTEDQRGELVDYAFLDDDEGSWRVGYDHDGNIYIGVLVEDEDEVIVDDNQAYDLANGLRDAADYEPDEVTSVGAGSNFDLILQSDHTILITEDGETGVIPALDRSDTTKLVVVLKELWAAGAGRDGSPELTREATPWLVVDANADGSVSLGADIEGGGSAGAEIGLGDLDTVIEQFEALLAAMPQRPDEPPARSATSGLARALVDVLLREWDPSKHPRDPLGRWAGKFGGLLHRKAVRAVAAAIDGWVQGKGETHADPLEGFDVKHLRHAARVQNLPIGGTRDDLSRRLLDDTRAKVLGHRARLRDRPAYTFGVGPNRPQVRDGEGRLRDVQIHQAPDGAVTLTMLDDSDRVGPIATTQPSWASLRTWAAGQKLPNLVGYVDRYHPTTSRGEKQRSKRLDALLTQLRGLDTHEEAESLLYDRDTIEVADLLRHLGAVQPASGSRLSQRALVDGVLAGWPRFRAAGEPEDLDLSLAEASAASTPELPDLREGSVYGDIGTWADAGYDMGYLPDDERAWRPLASRIVDGILARARKPHVPHVPGGGGSGHWKDQIRDVDPGEEGQWAESPGTKAVKAIARKVVDKLTGKDTDESPAKATKPRAPRKAAAPRAPRETAAKKAAPAAAKPDAPAAKAAKKAAPRKAAVHPAETAARDRQVKLDRSRKVAETLAEIDELRRAEASPQAMEHRVRARGRMGDLPPDLVDELVAAGISGDNDRINTVLDRVAREHGLTRTSGRAGAVEPFNRTEHEMLGGGPKLRDGQRAEIVRAGYTATVDGEKVRVQRAVVMETADAPSVEAPRAAKAARARVPATPTTSLTVDEQARVRRLVRSDPQIHATVQDRLGSVSSSGNLSEADAAWLQDVTGRDRAFVERAAQDMQIDRNINKAAREAGQTRGEYKAATAARLRELFAGKPIAVRVRDEAALRDIVSGGRFKTHLEGARRAPGLAGGPDTRRLGEHILGVSPDAPVEERPVYGYVAVSGIEPALSPGRRTPGIREVEGQEDVLSSYGQIQVVLRPDVRTRTTATVGDSLDEIGFMRPSPVDNPGAESLGYRSLDTVMRPDWTRQGYFEAQIHGGVRVDDIEEVVFPSEPSAALAKQLDDAGISYRVLRPGDAPSVEAPRPAKAVKATPGAARKATKAAPRTRRTAAERRRALFLEQLANDRSAIWSFATLASDIRASDGDTARLRAKADAYDREASRSTDPDARAHFSRRAEILRDDADRIDAFDREAATPRKASAPAVRTPAKKAVTGAPAASPAVAKVAATKAPRVPGVPNTAPAEFNERLGTARSGRMVADMPPVQVRVDASSGSDTGRWRAVEVTGLSGSPSGLLSAATSRVRVSGMANPRLRTPDGRPREDWEIKQRAEAGYTPEQLARLEEMDAAKKAKAAAAGDREIRALDRAMTQSHLPSDVVLWRGANSSDIGLPIGDAVGFEWTDAGFVGTSAERQVSQSFLGSNPVTMRILAPSGTPAIGIRGGGEAEVLLGRELRFRVVSESRTEHGARVLDVEVVPSRSSFARVPAKKAAPAAKAVEAPPRLPAARPATTPASSPEAFDERVAKAATGPDALASAPTVVTFDEDTDDWTAPGLPARDRVRVAKAVATYWGHGQDVNAYLRDGPEAYGPGGRRKMTAAAVRRTVADVDRLYESSHLTRPAVVWRGFGGRTLFGGDPDMWPDDLAGREWVDAGYVSTAASRAEAAHFVAGGSAGAMDRRGVMARILLPEGAPVLSLSEMEATELLLSRGWTFRVVRDHGWVDDVRPSGVRRQRLLDVEATPPAGAIPPTVGAKKAASPAKAARRPEGVDAASWETLRTLAGGEQASVEAAELPGLMDAITTTQPPTFNLAALQVAGEGNENLFQRHLSDERRVTMPQLPTETGPDLDRFEEFLRSNGIDWAYGHADPRRLVASQSELSGPKVARLYGFMRDAGWKKGGVLIISRDGAVIDGHHRWAGAAAASVARGGTLEVDVMVLDLDWEDALRSVKPFARFEDLATDREQP